VSALLAAEAYKLRTTRASLGTVVGLLAFVVLLLVIEFATASGAALTESSRQRQVVGVGSVATIFAALAGILAVTSEFRHGTITPTLLVSPRRLRLLWAKLAASALVGALLGGAGYGLGDRAPNAPDGTRRPRAGHRPSSPARPAPRRVGRAPSRFRWSAARDRESPARSSTSLLRSGPGSP